MATYVVTIELPNGDRISKAMDADTATDAARTVIRQNFSLFPSGQSVPIWIIDRTAMQTRNVTITFDVTLS